MVDFSLDNESDQEARWEAARQTLAMDAARGFKLLCQLSRDEADPLARPALELRTNLAAAHPALRALEKEAF